MNNYIFINQTNKHNILVTGEVNLTFDFQTYILDIFKSYNCNWSNVLNQFRIDLPRSNIMFNGINVQTYVALLTDMPIMFNIIIMLCCQSSLAYPMEQIINYYNLIDNNYLLLDNGKESMNINIIEFNKINIKKRLYISKLNDTLINMFYVDIELYFEILNIEAPLDFTLLDYTNVLTWTILNI